MLSKEEIEKAKKHLKKFCEYDDNLFLQDEILYEYQDDIETLLQYIDQLEQENKQYKEFITEANGKDIKDITATEYMKIKQEGYIQGRIEEQDKLIKCINKQNKIIDEMVNLLGSLKLSKDIQGYEIMEKEDWKQYFEKKVEEEK